MFCFCTFTPGPAGGHNLNPPQEHESAVREKTGMKEIHCGKMQVELEIQRVMIFCCPCSDCSYRAFPCSVDYIISLYNNINQSINKGYTNMRL